MADPGPQWLIWAHQMKTHHSDLVKQVQQNADATTRLIEGHADIVKQVQQNADAVAQQLAVSHSALHNETKTIRADLQLLSSNLGQVEKNCGAEFTNTGRRIINLEEQSGTLLGLVEGCNSKAETAIQRQGQQSHDLTGLKEYQRRENVDRKKEVDELRAQFEKLTYVTNRQEDVSQTFDIGADLARPSHQSQVATRRLSPSQIPESPFEHHSHREIWSGDLSKSPDGRSQATPFIGTSLSQGPINDTNASAIDDTTDFGSDHFPVSPPSDRHNQQSSDLITQDFYELDEYLMICGEAICSKLREYEKELIKQYINNMSNADQKATLVTSLNRKGWTWKSAEEATNTICLAEREKREADEEARRIAADETAHKARQPRPKPSTQRRKRKKKNW